MGFPEALTILFVALKLTHVIDWSWWLVLLPELIEVGVGVLIGLGFLIFYFTKD